MAEAHTEQGCASPRRRTDDVDRRARALRRARPGGDEHAREARDGGVGVIDGIRLDHHRLGAELVQVSHEGVHEAVVVVDDDDDPLSHRRWTPAG